MIFDYNTVRIAAIGDASKVHIWRVISEGHVRTELFETSLALGAVTIGVNQAADGGKVACLELGDCGADFGYTADDLMSGNAWIDSWYRTPLATNSVEVRVADTAEKDFDLNVMFARISPRNRGRGKRRTRAGS
jgi:hypothetical protein